jgi:hypothetical protein
MREDGPRKGVISTEPRQNEALVWVIWALCLLALAGLVVGYIVIKP